MSLTNEEQQYINYAITVTFRVSTQSLAFNLVHPELSMYEVITRLNKFIKGDFVSIAYSKGVKSSDAIAEKLQSLGLTVPEDYKLRQLAKENREQQADITKVIESSEIMKISLQTKDLQINELIAHNEKLVSQNNKQRTELDDTRIQLDKKAEKISEIENKFDVLKNMICESGAFNCDVMFGELPPEPSL